MKNFTMFCSPKHEYELDEHPQLKQELYGCFRDIKSNKQDIVLCDVDTSKKIIIYEPLDTEVVFAQKAPFLQNTYFLAENYETTCILKELELLRCVFEDMGAKEIIVTSSFECLEQITKEQSGGVSANSSATSPDPTKNVHVEAGIGAENRTQKDMGAKEKKHSRIVLKGIKKTKEQLKEYIEQNHIDIEGFHADAKKAISGYLYSGEINREELEIDYSSENFCKEKRELIANIGGNIGVGNYLSIVPEIKAKIENLKHQEKKINCSLKIIF